MGDTLLAQGDVANDSGDNSQREHDRQKKKTEGVAQPQTGEGEQTIPEEETSSAAKAAAKRVAGGKSGAKAPLKRASLKRAQLKRIGAKRVSAAKTVPSKEVAPDLVTSRRAKNNGGGTRATVVKKLLKNIEEKLSGKDVKASLGDYIRLVQLQKELDEEAPREIKVTWVEPGTRTTGKKSDKGSESGE